MDKMYIVKYDIGEYDSYKEVIVFATKNKSKATRYVKRFNKVMKNYRGFYSKFISPRWTNNSNYSYYDRWYNLQELGSCFMEQIQLR